MESSSSLIYSDIGHFAAAKEGTEFGTISILTCKLTIGDVEHHSLCLATIPPHVSHGDRFVSVLGGQQRCRNLCPMFTPKIEDVHFFEQVRAAQVFILEVHIAIDGQHLADC